MGIKWKDYQLKTAEYFKKLGLNALVEHKVEGIRGVHEIDVYVEGKIYGLPFIWIVECKAWKSNVPKEKVLTLSSIILDIGADKGFLLSEKGFQSGAIRLAEKTNITLSSLEDLNEDLPIDAIISHLNWRLQKAKIRLLKLKKDHFNDDYYPPMFKEMGELMILESVLKDALVNQYPFIYQQGIEVESLEHLLEISEEVLLRAENWV